jgi:hypothetical protein
MAFVYKCDNCNFQSINAYNYSLHLQTLKHAKKMRKVDDNPFKCFVCSRYETKDKSHFVRHVKTCRKRKAPVETPVKPEPMFTLSQVEELIQKMNTAPAKTEPVFTLSQVEELVQKIGTPPASTIEPILARLQPLDTIVEEIKKSIGQLNTTVINNINLNDNRTMNVGIFLNEHCKDAMNIMDFIKQIPLRVDHLDKFASQGYANAMSDIMITELNNMPLTQRPLHCTDVRRHTLHIKHEDAWHQETQDTPILLRAITTLRRLCQGLTTERFPPFAEIEPNTPNDLLYYRVMQQVTGGKETNRLGQSYVMRNRKIITNVCKAVKLNKTDLKPLVSA